MVGGHTLSCWFVIAVMWLGVAKTVAHHEVAGSNPWRNGSKVWPASTP